MMWQSSISRVIYGNARGENGLERMSYAGRPLFVATKAPFKRMTIAVFKYLFKGAGRKAAVSNVHPQPVSADVCVRHDRTRDAGGAADGPHGSLKDRDDHDLCHGQD